MISRICHLFDKSTLFIVINSLIFSKLFYCSSVWSGNSKSNIAKLQHVQNFAAHLLSGKKKYEHITPKLKELRLVPVSNAFRYRDAVQMFQCTNNQAPTYLKTMFQKRCQIHDYNNRNIDNLYLPKCRTALAQNSFCYRGAALWNSLPPEIRKLSNEHFQK